MTYGEGDEQKEKEEINLLEVCFSIRGKSMEIFLLFTEFSFSPYFPNTIQKLY